jgi:oligosaccharide repeat unit polymerase
MLEFLRWLIGLGQKAHIRNAIVIKMKPAAIAERCLNSSILANPIVIFVGMWTTVFFLYSLHLSEQLIFEIENFPEAYVSIVTPFIFGGLIVFLIYTNFSSTISCGAHSLDASIFERETKDIKVLKKRMQLTASLFIVGAIFEVISSSGVPVYWYLIANGKQHSDFGMPSIHGLLMSMMVAYATISYYLFKVTLDKGFLLKIAVILLWCVVLVSRNFLIATFLQLMFIELMFRKVPSKKLMYIFIIGLLFIVLFGVIGDFRTGSGDLILAVGRPTENYPSWLPSGFLWVYLYITTPLNNLLNNLSLGLGDHLIRSISTLAQLFPSVIRSIVFPEGSSAEALLVDPNLNVSTAFIDPVIDGGILGIIGYSFFMGVISYVFWLKRSRTFFMLGYAFIAQALILSIFFNHFLYLPYLMQLVWFSYFLKGLKGLVLISGKPIGISFSSIKRPH